MRLSRQCLISLVLLAACKDTSAPVPIDPVGMWSGTTSQGRAVAFTVTASGVTEATISYRVVGDFCTADVEMTVGGSPVPIANNQFSTEFSTGSADFSVTGQFTSSTSASGTLQVADFNCDGSLTTNWTATK